MKTYDAIVVLGSQPDPETWEFPGHTYNSLERAAELMEGGVAPVIVVSGDRSLRLDNTGIVQPFRECDRLAEYLVSIGCQPEQILKEGESRDTISNFYFLKNLVFIPNEIKSALVVTAEFRVERLRFLWQKIMGTEYGLEFELVDCLDSDINPSEILILELQRKWLEDVRPGDDSWFSDKFYDDPYYLSNADRDRAAARLSNI